MLPGLLAIGLAHAHRPGLSYARIDADTLTLTIARPDLEGRIPAGDLQESRLLLADLTVHDLRVDVGGPCTLDEPSVTPVEGDGVQIEARLHCPGAHPGELLHGTYDADFLAGMEAGHRHYVEAFGQSVAVLDVQQRHAEFTGAPDRSDVALRFGKLGVEHIWTGYDHLLFLLGLLLTAPSLRAMLFIVTGFTVAHSITLSLAALELVHVSPALVEPAIAASIVFVGVENLWRPTPRRRVMVTFALGLVHGFGFAGLLVELGLPRDALALALVSFNGGVEVGQGAVVALAMPLLLSLRRLKGWEPVVRGMSAVIAVIGALWFLERVT